MPIYEYKCHNCNHRFDLFESMGTTNENLICPECGAPKPERLFSMFGALGSGTSSNNSAVCSSKGPFT